MVATLVSAAVVLTVGLVVYLFRLVAGVERK